MTYIRSEEKTMSAMDEAAHIHKAFVMMPTEVLADVAMRKISAPACVLYAFILFWQGDKSDTFFGIEAMARETDFSVSKVKDLIKELRNAGHISRKRKMGATWRTRCMTVVKNGALYIRSKWSRNFRQEAIKGHDHTETKHVTRPERPPPVSVSNGDKIRVARELFGRPAKVDRYDGEGEEPIVRLFGGETEEKIPEESKDEENEPLF